MGFQIEITDLVTVELRRASFMVYIGETLDVSPVDTIEISYDHAEAVQRALTEVLTSERYTTYMRRKR